MDIKEALARIEALERDIKDCGELVYMAQRDDERGVFKVHEIALRTFQYEGRCFSLKLSDFCALLNNRRDEAQAELDKLKPIIEMANLALRGLANEN